MSAPPGVGTGVVCKVLRGSVQVVREGIAASVFFSPAWKDEWESSSLEDLISSWIQVHLGLGRYFFVGLVLLDIPMINLMFSPQNSFHQIKADI